MSCIFRSLLYSVVLVLRISYGPMFDFFSLSFDLFLLVWCASGLLLGIRFCMLHHPEFTSLYELNLKYELKG